MDTFCYYRLEEYIKVIFVVVYAMEVMCLRFSGRNIMGDLVRIFSKLKLGIWFTVLL